MTDLPQLPVPELSHTLEAVARSAAALGLSPDVGAFADGAGPELQAALLNFAAHENAHGRSWVQTDWLRGYFGSRTPLPLTSSVGFALNLPPTLGDPHDLAMTIHRMASAHLEQVRAEFPQITDARGTHLDMGQFAALSGGLRHPHVGFDEFRSPTAAAARREIGVFVDGRLFALTVSDDAGRPLAPDALAPGLGRIAARAAGSADDVGQDLPGGFAGFSYLGSAEVAPLLQELFTDGRNERTYERLTDLLFTVTLAGHAPLLATLVQPGRAWAYKPLSYQLDVDRGTWSVHVEHSMFDGGMLVDAVARMQSIDPDGTAARAASDAAAPEPQELRWQTSAALRERMARGLSRFEDEARHLKAVRLHLPRVPDAELPRPMSLDALHQLVLTLAQLLTYGRVRGVYESVDMRGFVGGRTECLRPVTSEAVDLARALRAGNATASQLEAVLAAHRVQVKACKSGSGFDRHLLGLQESADRLGLHVPFFSDPDLAALRRDMLSTTSLGTPAQVIDYVFAPTTPEGFGICYTPYPDALGFVVTYDDATAEAPEAFLSALEHSAGLLQDFLRSLH